MQSLQTGYAAHAHLGTPVAPELKRASEKVQALKNSTAQKLFEATMATPDMSMNDRKAFRVAPTVLQGPNLTNTPRGGFTSADFLPRTVIGASATSDGLEASVRQFPVYFKGDVLKKTIGPTKQHTYAGNAVYQEGYDGKTRSGIGSMSIARMDEEIKAGNKKREAHYAKLFSIDKSNEENAPIPVSESSLVLEKEKVHRQPPVSPSILTAIPTFKRLQSAPAIPEDSAPWKMPPLAPRPQSMTSLASVSVEPRREQVPETEFESVTVKTDVALVESVMPVRDPSRTNDQFYGINKQSLVIATAFSAIVLLLIIVIIIQGSPKSSQRR